MKKNGFTLIELLAIIVILAIILVIAVPLVLDLITKTRTNAYNLNIEMIKKATETYVESGRKEISGTTAVITIDELINGGYISPILDPTDRSTECNGYVEVGISGSDVTYTPSMKCGDNYESDGYDPVLAEGGTPATVVVNAPVLMTGMVPIKWNGSAWVDTIVSDTDWYNYATKKWANARTDDCTNPSDPSTCSMWVWIPRYVYRISSGFHSGTEGTIDIQFSTDIDDTKGGTVTLDTGTTSAASNNKWTSHPAFTFNTGNELTGIWVAKFEATAAEGVSNTATGDNVTTKTVKVVPNVQSWRYIRITNAFTVCRNMETNSAYGWGTSGNGLDTHLMKNSEWGAIAYLSKSIYGKGNEKVWLNPADNYTTGCAGDSADSIDTVGCLRSYETTNGQEASTTGTIYGVYDMNGSSWERVAGYVDNAHLNLTTYGSALTTADPEYKDVYTVGTPDGSAGNYALTVNKKGDAVWETSNGDSGINQWFNDYPYMFPTGSCPFIIRGSCAWDTQDGSLFSFDCGNGNSHDTSAFRPVIVER